jgi:hypothetical protein
MLEVIKSKKAMDIDEATFRLDIQKELERREEIMKHETRADQKA